MSAVFDIMATLCVLLGAFFCVVTLVGVMRFPDVLNRMHAASKAGTFGASLPLLAVVFSDAELSTSIRAAATIGFLFMTGPVAAHLLSRAAYLRSQDCPNCNVVDELAEAGVTDPSQVASTQPQGTARSLASAPQDLGAEGKAGDQ